MFARAFSLCMRTSSSALCDTAPTSNNRWYRATSLSAFAKAGKEKSPVAIIQNGTRNDEKTGFGTIETIEKVVQEKQLSSPAIIVIGNVVEDRSILSETVASIEEKGYHQTPLRYA